MRLIVMALLCCVFVMILSIPFASTHAPDEFSPFQATDAVRSTSFVLARKFKITPEAKVTFKVETQGFQVPNQKDGKESIPGDPYKMEQNRLNLSREQERNWVEVADMSSRFFTVDYAHVKRRRPVNNMSSLRHP